MYNKPYNDYSSNSLSPITNQYIQVIPKDRYPVINTHPSQPTKGDRSFSPAQSISSSYRHGDILTNPEYRIVGTQVQIQDPYNNYSHQSSQPHQVSQQIIYEQIPLGQHNEQNNKLKERILLMGAQIERLNNEMIKAIGEIDDNRDMIQALRLENMNVQGSGAGNDLLKKENELMKRNNEALINEIEMLRGAENSMRNQIDELHGRIAQSERKATPNQLVESQLDNYRNHIQEYEKRVEQLKYENSNLKNRISALERNNVKQSHSGDIAKNFQKEIKQLTQKFIQEQAQLDAENRQLRAQLNDLKLRNSRLQRSAHEIGGTPKRQRDLLLQELNDLRTQYHEIENVLRGIGNIEMENQVLKGKLDQFKNKLHQQNSKKKDDFILEEENRKLKRDIQANHKEIEDLRAIVSQQGGYTPQIADQQQIIRDLNDRIQNCDKHIIALQAENRKMRDFYNQQHPNQSQNPQEGVWCD